MRLRIAERLKESQNTAASLTTFNEVDMSNLMEMRKLYKDEFLEKTGVKLGFMGAFSKAACLAAKDIPAVNAAIENNDTLVFRDYTDISIAVATPKGLVTPIVRNAEFWALKRKLLPWVKKPEMVNWPWKIWLVVHLPFPMEVYLDHFMVPQSSICLKPQCWDCMV